MDLTFRMATKSSVMSSSGDDSAVPLAKHRLGRERQTLTGYKQLDQKLNAKFNVAKLLGASIPFPKQRGKHSAPLFTPVRLGNTFEEPKGSIAIRRLNQGWIMYIHT